MPAASCAAAMASSSVDPSARAPLPALIAALIAPLSVVFQAIVCSAARPAVAGDATGLFSGRGDSSVEARGDGASGAGNCFDSPAGCAALPADALVDGCAGCAALVHEAFFPRSIGLCAVPLVDKRGEGFEPQSSMDGRVGRINGWNTNE